MLLVASVPVCSLIFAILARGPHRSPRQPWQGHSSCAANSLAAPPQRSSAHATRCSTRRTDSAPARRCTDQSAKLHPPQAYRNTARPAAKRTAHAPRAPDSPAANAAPAASR
eukprot:TRINITY_DN78449_c0_g1_i1.p2 TRINITY_DN78449_c0_g1~~TRINITY_DN78449_c0_g1_i1.p2  ORF type:complete len:112 (+),score=3.00 TRINITY_DN78449_c0_g1_i1:128-463(+)